MGYVSPTGTPVNATPPTSSATPAAANTANPAANKANTAALMPPFLKPPTDPTVALFQTAMTNATAKKKAAASPQKGSASSTPPNFQPNAGSILQPGSANLLGSSGGLTMSANTTASGNSIFGKAANNNTLGKIGPKLLRQNTLTGSQGGDTSTITNMGGNYTTRTLPNGDIEVTSKDGKVTTTTTNGKVTTIKDGNLTISQAPDGTLTTQTTSNSAKARALRAGGYVGNNTTLYQSPQLSGSTNHSAYSTTVANSHGSIGVSLLNEQTSGSLGGSLSIKDGISGNASGSAGLFAVDAKGGAGVGIGRSGNASVSGDASVGVDGSGSAQVAFNPLRGTADANIGASGFIGGQANENGGVTIDGTGVSETAGVGAGIGFTAKANVGVEDGKVEANLDLGGYLGIGGKVDLSVSVNPPAIAKGIAHVGSTIWHDII